ncbi:DMT family transporter [Azospirillum sp. SYSU D00513]|uniref:DMT family transporter n=1 Tax=Azospirillum sp. SYSU D00513 TaxID=2812561 RepID=UPI001A96CD83|nr:DMT family transporter [Azospirillum sp. SYSU D00513]
MTAAIASPASDSRAGILFMVLGMSLFTFNDALGKWLVADYSIAVVMAVRSLFAVAILMPFVTRQGLRRVFGGGRTGFHLLRVACVTGEMGLFYLAVRHLPLANVMTIYMAAPLMVTALSVVLLREKVGWRRWAAVLVGFGGVVMVLNPTGDFELMPSLIALLGTFVFSVGLITTRMLRESSSLTLVSYQTFGALFAGGVALPVAWTPPATMTDFLLLGLLGVVALSAHVAMNRSLQISPAAVVVPFQYVSIVWAVALDLLVWGTAPTARMLLGAAVIIGSGLFIFYREQAVQQGAAAEAGASPSRET